MPDVLGRPRVLIIGASRGIGAALAKQYASGSCEVHVTLRKMPAAGADTGLPASVIIHEMDMCNPAQIAALGESFHGKKLDILIVAAGTYDRVGGAFGNGPAVPPEQVFQINTEAPMLIAESVFNSLKLDNPGKMVFISSAEGIRRGRQNVGVYGQSKAALNDKIRQYAEEWAWFGVIGIALHPGWVKTDMGGDRAPITANQSATGIRQVVAALTPENCGAFLDFRGNNLPW